MQVMHEEIELDTRGLRGMMLNTRKVSLLRTAPAGAAAAASQVRHCSGSLALTPTMSEPESRG